MLRSPWAVLVLLLALVEGAALLGSLTQLPSVLESWTSGSRCWRAAPAGGCRAPGGALRQRFGRRLAL